MKDTKEKYEILDSTHLLEDYVLKIFNVNDAELLEDYADSTMSEIFSAGEVLGEIPICKTLEIAVKAITSVRY